MEQTSTLWMIPRELPCFTLALALTRSIGSLFVISLFNILFYQKRSSTVSLHLFPSQSLPLLPLLFSLFFPFILPFLIHYRDVERHGAEADHQSSVTSLITSNGATVAYLLSQGAIATLTDSLGRTPLHYACGVHDLSVIEALMEVVGDAEVGGKNHRYIIYPEM